MGRKYTCIQYKYAEFVKRSPRIRKIKRKIKQNLSAPSMLLHLALSGIQVLWLPHLSFNLLCGITIVEIAFLYRHRDW